MRRAGAEAHRALEKLACAMRFLFSRGYSGYGCLQTLQNLYGDVSVWHFCDNPSFSVSQFNFAHSSCLVPQL